MLQIEWRVRWKHGNQVFSKLSNAETYVKDLLRAGEDIKKIVIRPEFTLFNQETVSENEAAS